MGESVGGSLAFLKRYPQALSYVVGSSNCPLVDFLRGNVDLFK